MIDKEKAQIIDEFKRHEGPRFGSTDRYPNLRINDLNEHLKQHKKRSSFQEGTLKM